MKVDRLVSIIMILLDKERIGAQALAEMFEVSPRTIYRDIEAINAAGIPIRSTSGVGGGFEIMEQYKVDRKVFSTADLSTILMGLSNLSSLIRGQELVNALAKVKSFIPADKAKDIELKANQICVDISPWMHSPNIQPNLEMVKTALQECRLTTFQYSDGHGNQTTRTAEPYQLVLKGSHWYFQGYCYKRKDFRLFKLSRISNLKTLEAHFTPRDYPKPILDFDRMLPSMQTRITLRIHSSLLDRILDFCDYEDCTPDGDGHYRVAFPFIENDFYYNLLLGFGPQCQCLGPSNVRAEMKRRTREMASLYEN